MMVQGQEPPKPDVVMDDVSPEANPENPDQNPDEEAAADDFDNDGMSHDY
jgi:hypothetical protein